MSLAQRLSEALKLHTVLPWGDGQRVKVRFPNVWVTYKGGRGAGGQVVGDIDAMLRAKKERDALHSTLVDFEKDFKAGHLAKGMTFGRHVEIAKVHLRKHAASMNRLIGDLEKIAPGEKNVGGYERVSGRVKTLSSVLGKVVRKHHRKLPSGEWDKSKPHLDRADKLKDMTGARILAEDTKGTRAVFDKFKAKYGDDIVSSEDMISHPREDGYRSIHAEFKDADGLVKEIQFRTPNQQTWANWSHDIYKPTKAKQREWLREAKKDPAMWHKIDKYATSMSAHYAKIDDGEKPGDKPECPEELKKSPFGCLD